MAEDQTTQGTEQEESGSTLRKKLEAALAENATLLGELSTSKAQSLISEKGYTLVTAEDLKGVPLADIESKAAALETQRFEQGKESFKAILAARGLTGDALEQAVTSLFEQSSNEQTLAAIDRLRTVGSTTGTPVSRTNFDDVEAGPARIKAALSAGKKK